MKRALPRAHFNSAHLVHFLTENAMLAPACEGAEWGQKLGDWLNFRQAIALHGVLNPDIPSATPPAHLRRSPTMTGQALRRLVDKLRAQLVQSIEQGAPPGTGLARIEMPAPELDNPLEPKTAFEPYRRFYAAHQRQMEVSVQKLRAQLRTQLRKCSAPLQQLADLDERYENILSERESVLLGQVAKLHEKRFVQALKLHIKQCQESDQGAERQAVSVWLMPLRQAMRSALLAELDTRLQPTLGLLDAFNQENPQEQ